MIRVLLYKTHLIRRRLHNSLCNKRKAPYTPYLRVKPNPTQSHSPHVPVRKNKYLLLHWKVITYLKFKTASTKRHRIHNLTCEWTWSRRETKWRSRSYQHELTRFSSPTPSTWNTCAPRTHTNVSFKKNVHCRNKFIKYVNNLLLFPELNYYTLRLQPSLILKLNNIYSRNIGKKQNTTRFISALNINFKFWVNLTWGKYRSFP